MLLVRHDLTYLEFIEKIAPRLMSVYITHREARLVECEKTYDIDHCDLHVTYHTVICDENTTPRKTKMWEQTFPSIKEICHLELCRR